MYKNNNKEVIREVGMDNFQTHASRNIIAVVAIALTTVLITAVLTVGISFSTTIMNFGNAAPGPGCQGSIATNKEQVQKVKKLPQVKWADYIQDSSISPLRNDEFAGMEVHLLTPEQSYLKHNYVDLIKGHYPEKSNEIILSDTLAKRLKIKSPVGKELKLSVMIGKEDNAREKMLKLKICGYFDNPLVTLEDAYDEIFTSQKFLPAYNPQLTNEPGETFVNLNNLNPFLLKSDVEAKLAAANHAVGGSGVSTKYTKTFGDVTSSALPALLFVLFIMLSGYFLIYNIFAISVAGDIRWFGMLKTLGTTPKQLKKILMIQIRRLAFVGILIGGIGGYLIGNRIAPDFMKITEYGQFYKSPNMLLVFVIGALFAWLTVYISARKSIKMVAMISPIEAAHYVPKKKKNLFTVLSLALSGIIFMVACNVALGFSVDKMVERYNQQDVNITHKCFKDILSNEKYQPLDLKLVEKIRKLPYVTRVDTIYEARTMPDFYKEEKTLITADSVAQVKPTGPLKKVYSLLYDGISKEEKHDSSNQFYFMDNGDVRMTIEGLPSNRLLKNKKYIEVLDGKLDEQKFATGNYIVWQNSFWFGNANASKAKKVIHAGQTLKLKLYDDVTKKYTAKNMQVMAVIDSANQFGTGDLEGDIIMPNTAYRKLYPDYNQQIVSLQIETKGEVSKKQNQEIAGLMAQTHNSQLKLDSRYLIRITMNGQKYTMEIIGLFFALILGIIGISNVINTITSDVLSRKLELAGMQSIGMTKRQLWRYLFKDSLKFTLPSILVILPIGGLLSKAVGSAPLFTGFSVPWLFISTILIVGMIFLVALIVTTVLVYTLNKKSLVERLRESE